MLGYLENFSHVYGIGASFLVTQKFYRETALFDDIAGSEFILAVLKIFSCQSIVPYPDESRKFASSEIRNY